MNAHSHANGTSSFIFSIVSMTIELALGRDEKQKMSWTIFQNSYPRKKNFWVVLLEGLCRNFWIDVFEIPKRKSHIAFQGFAVVMCTFGEILRRPSDPRSFHNKNNDFESTCGVSGTKLDRLKQKILSGMFLVRYRKKLFFKIFGRVIFDSGT